MGLLWILNFLEPLISSERNEKLKQNTVMLASARPHRTRVQALQGLFRKHGVDIGTFVRNLQHYLVIAYCCFIIGSTLGVAFYLILILLSQFFEYLLSFLQAYRARGEFENKQNNKPVVWAPLTGTLKKAISRDPKKQTVNSLRRFRRDSQESVDDILCNLQIRIRKCSGYDKKAQRRHISAI